MTIRHHPAESTLAAFAAGALGEASAVVIATHLSLCPACRAPVRLLEAVGGTLLEGLPPTALDPGALARTLARLDAPGATTARRPAAGGAALPGDLKLPPPLAPYVAGRWRSIAPGLRVMRLLPPDREGTRLDLLRISPGMTLPPHGHRGRELTCVLAGSFTDAAGTFAPGDLAETDAAVAHRPVIGPGGPCISVAATQGRLRMHSLLARLLQPLTGF